MEEQVDLALSQFPGEVEGAAETMPPDAAQRQVMIGVLTAVYKEFGETTGAQLESESNLLFRFVTVYFSESLEIWEDQILARLRALFLWMQKVQYPLLFKPSQHSAFYSKHGTVCQGESVKGLRIRQSGQTHRWHTTLRFAIQLVV